MKFAIAFHPRVMFQLKEFLLYEALYCCIIELFNLLLSSVYKKSQYCKLLRQIIQEITTADNENLLNLLNHFFCPPQ